VQRLGGEVAADEAPVGPVGCGVDVAGVEERVGLDERRAVREGGAVPDEDAVRDTTVGDEDSGCEEAEGDDGPVARVQLTEERADVEARPPHQREKLGQEHWRRRARRERWPTGLTTTLLWVLAAMAPVKQVED